jgi:hypothetical protein
MAFLHILHRLSARLFRWFGYASAAALLALALIAVAAMVAPSLDPLALLDSDNPLVVAVGLVVVTLAAGVPFLLPFVSLSYLTMSMIVGQDPTDRDVIWSATTLVMSAVGLFLLLNMTVCADTGYVGFGACQVEPALFLVDQFYKGSLGDVFDIFDIRLSTLLVSDLTAFEKVYLLAFRTLTAALLLTLIVVALSAARATVTSSDGTGPQRPRAWPPASLARLHRLLEWTFRRAAIGSGILLILLFCVIAVGELAPGLIDLSPEAELGVGNGLLIVLIALPTLLLRSVVPLVSLAYMVSSHVFGSGLSRRDLWLLTGVVVMCAFGLHASLTTTLCTDSPWALTSAQCETHAAGFLIDQFAKGAFADLFDIYDWTLSSVDVGDLSLMDKLSILNFRLLSGVYLLLLIVAVTETFRRKPQPTDLLVETNRGQA